MKAPTLPALAKQYLATRRVSDAYAANLLRAANACKTLQKGAINA